MNILYVADSSSYHNALWTRFFAERHKVFLFSDLKLDYNKVNFHKDVTLFQSLPVVNSKSRHLNKVLSLYKYKQQIEEIIRNYNIDIIHSVALYYAYLASLVATDLPVIYTQQGSELLVRARKNRVYRFMARKAFKRCNIVTGDSAAIQNAGYLYGAPHKNNYIIQNGVDLKLFRPMDSSLRKELRLEEDCHLLFSPRALDPLYNIDSILAALALLKNNGVKYKCLFCFPFGDQRLDELKALASSLDIEEHVIWKGYVDYAELPKYYSAADLVLSIPSSDSSPKSVYEAMACGTPVVVSDLPWSGEILKSGHDIVKVPVRDPASTAETIQGLLADPSRRGFLSLNALETVKLEFSFEANMARMESIMLNTISGDL